MLEAHERKRDQLRKLQVNERCNATSNQTMEATMNTRAHWFRLGATWWTVLSVSTICATFVSLPAARAQDFNQQSTSAEKDDAVNWRAATGARHAYARAPYEFQRPRRVRSHRHH